MKKEFFAVTASRSVYHICYNEDEVNFSAKKILLLGYSTRPLGENINYGIMLGIGKTIFSFIPDSAILTPSRMWEIRGINRMTETSHIVGLFNTEKEATKCAMQKNLKPFDQRWLEKTKETLQSIEDNHPVFYKCSYVDIGIPIELY